MKYAIPRNYEKLGLYLREMRLKAELSQREVAQALDYSSAQFISNFERGISVPPLPRMKLLVKLYKLNVNTVIDLTFEAERVRIKKILLEGKN